MCNRSLFIAVIEPLLFAIEWDVMNVSHAYDDAMVNESTMFCAPFVLVQVDEVRVRNHNIRHGTRGLCCVLKLVSRRSISVTIITHIKKSNRFRCVSFHFYIYFDFFYGSIVIILNWKTLCGWLMCGAILTDTVNG